MRRPIYDYTYLDLPFDQASDLLAGAPSEWLPGPARPDGGTFVVELEDAVGRTVDAAVSVGEPRRNDGTKVFVRPLSWEGAVTPGFFPRLQADLELSPLSHDRTQLTFVGSYRPPAAVVGDVMDRAAGHRVAESVVRTFLIAVADRLTHGTRTLAS